MIPFETERVLINVRKSTTEDLLNRVTVYRAGMEPEAIHIIEEELSSRGVCREEILEYAERMGREVIFREDGMAAKCSFCHDPAVVESWGWHRIFGRLPLFPRYFYYCREHQPQVAIEEPEPTEEAGEGEE